MKGQPVEVIHASLVIPTYQPNLPDPHPVFHEKRSYQGASGRVYPLSVTNGLGHEKQDKAWDCYTLENEYLLPVGDRTSTARAGNRSL